MNKVFESAKIGSFTCRNHIVRSATVDPLGNPDETVSDEQVKMYGQFAADHVGLIITAMISVSPEGRSQGQLSIYDDRFIEGHKRLTDAVHKNEGIVVCQINHCGAGSMKEPRLSPSGVPSPLAGGAPAVEMTKEDMERVKKDFVDAAVRAKKAGYDGIQLHLAHGYLLSEFINPMFNKRTDEYGGSLENRFRYPVEVFTAIKEAVGPDFPVAVKINSNLEEGDEGFEKDLVTMCKCLKELGVDFIEISGCDFTPRGRKGLHNYYLERAELVKKEADVPVILVGGVRTAEDMDEVLSHGIDAVSLSRPFISEPDLVLKLERGEKSRCISCSKCFVLMFKYTPGAPRCILDVKKD